MKPNAIQHMLLWGMILGGILGTLITIVALTLAIDPAIPVYRVLLNPGALLLVVSGLSLGAVIGLLTGTANGILLMVFLRLVAPFRTREAQIKRALFMIPLLTIMMTITSASILGIINERLALGNWFQIIPAVLAGITLQYPVYRYLTRIRRWYMIQPDHTYDLSHLTDDTPDNLDDNAIIDTSQSLSERQLLS